MARAASRRRRGPNDYARRPAMREQYATVLIVCEGEKTEPRYLRSLCALHRLSNANIRVTPAEGTDPVSIVQYALREMADFDRAYCVFDRNGHANYDDALRQIADSDEGRAGRLIGTTSWPCFEFWLLLHFRYSAAPFARSGNNSSCDMVLRALRQHLEDYTKGGGDTFALVQHLTDTAVRNAQRLARENARTQSANPATRMHELVNYLRGLKPLE